MRRAVLYATSAGLLGGLVLGGGTHVFGEIPTDIVIHWRGLTLDLGANRFLRALVIVPFALAGVLAGSFSGYVVVFGCRELGRFSGSWERAFGQYRRPIAGLTLGGALAAVLLAGSLPVTPGLYPRFVEPPAAQPGRGPAPGDVDPWREIETLQTAALAQRGDGLVDRFQRAFTRAFFAFLRGVHAVALSLLGGTLAGWSALVCATFLVSRRAGGEGLFWSLWLLAGGFFLGIVTIVAFGFAFGGLGPGAPAELYLYSMVNTGIPAAWITLAAAAGNTAFGLLGLGVRWRSALAGLLAAANAGAVLILGTTTRLTLVLNPPTPRSQVGVELPTPAWHILTYFEGHLVAPGMAYLPSAPLATLGVVIGVALAFGGAFYGMNLSSAEMRRGG